MYYVYIIKGNQHYVGVTNDLDRRFREHKNKQNYFTSRIGDEIELLGYFEFDNKKEALLFESKIKKSGHIKRYLSDEKFIWASSSVG